MPDIYHFFQQLVNGLTIGSTYALIAIGYTMVYGIIGMINFAHGEVYMIGTFVALTVVLEAGVTRGSPPAELALILVLALVIAIAACALLNVAIERLAYRRLRNAPRLADRKSVV